MVHFVHVPTIYFNRKNLEKCCSVRPKSDTTATDNALARLWYQCRFYTCCYKIILISLCSTLQIYLIGSFSCLRKHKKTLDTFLNHLLCNFETDPTTVYIYLLGINIGFYSYIMFRVNCYEGTTLPCNADV